MSVLLAKEDSTHCECGEKSGHCRDTSREGRHLCKGRDLVDQLRKKDDGQAATTQKPAQSRIMSTEAMDAGTPLFSSRAVFISTSESCRLPSQGGVKCPVGEDEVGAGSNNPRHRLTNHSLAVKPSVCCRGLNHGVLAGDLIGGNGNW